MLQQISLTSITVIPSGDFYKYKMSHIHASEGHSHFRAALLLLKVSIFKQ